MCSRERSSWGVVFGEWRRSVPEAAGSGVVCLGNDGGRVGEVRSEGFAPFVCESSPSRESDEADESFATEPVSCG